MQDELAKLVQLLNVHDKLVQKKHCLRNNVQRRYFAAVVDSEPITSDISERANSECMGIFLARIVHTDVLLADITSMPHNTILSRYLTQLGDFKLNRNG